MRAQRPYHLMEDPMPRALRLCAPSSSCAFARCWPAAARDDSSSTDGRTRRQEGLQRQRPTIDITFKGDKSTPQGAQLKVEAGKPIKLHIVADKPGELHVHSSPEQEIEYPAGTTDKTLTIDQPGVVDVESHTLDKLVAQLEVR